MTALQPEGEIDHIPVSSSGAVVQSTVKLTKGVDYQIQASGTVTNGSDPNADSSYGYYPETGETEPEAYSPTYGVKYGIIINGADPGWGAYQPSHVYTIDVVGQGQPLSFFYGDDDGLYGDNSGNLMVDISLAGAIKVVDQAHIENAISTAVDVSPSQTLYVPENSNGNATVTFSGLQTLSANNGTWSVTGGGTASPGTTGTFTSDTQGITLTPGTGNGAGTGAFAIKLNDNNGTGKSTTFHVQLMPWEIDPQTVQDTPTTTAALLPLNQKTTPGAFVPVDDGDYDYDGKLDMNEPVAPTGDDRLLPVLLNGTGDSVDGDYYTLSAPGIPDNSLRIFEQDHTGDPYTVVTPATHLQADANRTIFVEGINPGYATLYLNWNVNGAIYRDVDKVQVTVFEMSGPLNVPGNGIYEYKASATSQIDGSNLLPTGSAWIGSDEPVVDSGDPTVPYIASQTSSSDVMLQWSNNDDNPGQGYVGNAKYFVNSNYEWSLDVNVVQIEIDTNPGTDKMNFRQGAVQGGPNGTTIFSNTVAPHSTYSQLTVISANGPMGGRGLSHIQLGFIQLVSLTSDYADFNTLPKASGTGTGRRRQNSLMGPNYYLDQITYPGSRSTYPWYDSDSMTGEAGPSAKDFLSLTNSGLDNQVFQIGDEPGVPASDVMSLTEGGNTGTASYFGLTLDFKDYFAARTTDSENGASLVYLDLADASWEFNGSGPVSAEVWTPVASTRETTGSTTFTPPTLIGQAVSLPENRVPMNDLYFGTASSAGSTWSTVDTPS